MEKIELKLEKWRHAFEMNGIVPSKQDLKTYEKVSSVINTGTGRRAEKIFPEMVLADAMTEEGEYLLHSDFC